MRTAFVLAAMFVAALTVFAQAPAPAPATDDRIGLEETFDTMDGWRKLDFERETAPLKEMKSENGVAYF